MEIETIAGRGVVKCLVVDRKDHLFVLAIGSLVGANIDGICAWHCSGQDAGNISDSWGAVAVSQPTSRPFHPRGIRAIPHGQSICVYIARGMAVGGCRSGHLVPLDSSHCRTSLSDSDSVCCHTCQRTN